MNGIAKHTRSAGLAVILAIGMVGQSEAATISASSCSESAVRSAIDSASNGDTVTVPAGSCSWNSGFTISKGIHLKGAGPTSTKINMGGTLRISKNANHSIELSGFAFSKSGGGNAARILVVDGSWSAKPPLIHDNVFNVNGSGAIRYEANGGVIYGNTFNGTWDESAIQHKNDNDNQSWSSRDTMGTRDTTGESNLYVEDNVFNNMPNQATDFDDGGRAVFRHNTLNNSSFNSHGYATSPLGVRHFEIYENEFNYRDPNVNQNWMIWIRGGTGVIFNNVIQDIRGQQWGDKPEILFSVRAAVDGSGPGCGPYPRPRQIGRGHDGSREISDPLFIWNNSGSYRIGLNDGWGNSCGVSMGDYIKDGRDYYSSSQRPNYSPYQYPHPLRLNKSRPNSPSDITVRQ